MNRLLKIVRSATPGTGLHLRDSAYGKEGVRDFLRDVIALANAGVEGPRYILTGVAVDRKGNKRLETVNREDFTGTPAYASLVSDYIEPAIRIRYQPVTVDGKRVGAFEITDCEDRPYMMRIDFSETLRRGDAYTRNNDTIVKLGRRQLQQMFEQKFREAVSLPDESVEIGFPGDIIHKDFKLGTTDLTELPSAIAAGKIHQMLDTRKQFANTGRTTMMARLTHARLYGSDAPYEHRSTDDLLRDVTDIREKHHIEDDYFLFEQNAQKLEIVVRNQGDETIRNASLTLVLPNHNSLYVAHCLPMLRKEEKWVERGPLERASYPTVNEKDEAIHVSVALGDIATDATVSAFESPLRLCVGQELAGRKIGIRYVLSGSNLRNTLKGKLRLKF